MTPATDLVSVEYDQHKAEVIRTVAAKLSAAGVALPESDLDASYNEAWHALYLTLAEGEEIENRVGYLVTVTHRRALNEIRARKVARRADPADLDSVGVELDLDSRIDAEIQLRQIREGFRATLSPRELEAATLCHLYGYTRPEAAEAMGVRPKRMEKIMDRASARIGTVVETVRSGEHCASLSSTIRAFALGVLDPESEKYRLASEHLEHCPACRRDVWTDRGLAAIGPPLPIAFALLAGGATAGGGVAGGLALKGGAGKGAAAAGGKAGGAARAGASNGRKAAIAGGATATVAVVAAAAALATGTIGGGSEAEPGSGPAPVMAGAEGSSSESASAASKVRAAAARRAAKRARARAAARKKRLQARRAAAAAAAAAVAAPQPETVEAPEPVYVPPPAPEPEPVSEPDTTKPARPTKPSEPRKPEREEPQATGKLTTDAGEEFGLR